MPGKGQQMGFVHSCSSARSWHKNPWKAASWGLDMILQIFVYLWTKGSISELDEMGTMCIGLSPDYHRFCIFASITLNPLSCPKTFVSPSVKLCCNVIPSPIQHEAVPVCWYSLGTLGALMTRRGFVTREQSLELSRGFISTSCTLTVEQCLSRCKA